MQVELTVVWHPRPGSSSLREMGGLWFAGHVGLHRTAVNDVWYSPTNPHGRTMCGAALIEPHLEFYWRSRRPTARPARARA